MAELPAIIDDPDTRLALRRAGNTLLYAAGQRKTVRKLMPAAADRPTLGRVQRVPGTETLGLSVGFLGTGAALYALTTSYVFMAVGAVVTTGLFVNLAMLIAKRPPGRDE